ncbi:MAG: PorP/SprF family type IX secretion system membrane protein [Bacteroidia bacterium]|nr:PorP/SprF family type IX secretion system membrane protein [Bacteroidia bacterium]
MKTIRLFLVAFSLVSLFAKAQDVNLENTNQSLIFLNPSFAGSNGGMRLQSYYRNQWPQLTYNITNYNLAFDMYLSKLKGGFSVSYLNDNVWHGLLKANTLSVAYAQHFSLMNKKVKIIPSLELSYIHRNLDINMYSFSEYIDPRYGRNWSGYSNQNTATKQNADVSAGLLVTYKNINGGATLKHLTQPDVGILGTSKMPTLLNIHTSYTKHFNEKTMLQFMVRYGAQRDYRSAQANVNAVLFKHLVLGAGYSNGDVAMASLGYRNKYISALIGNNFVVSKLAGKTNSIWSISFSMMLRKGEKVTELGNFENW